MKQTCCAHGHGGGVQGLRTPPPVTPGITDSPLTDRVGIE